MGMGVTAAPVVADEDTDEQFNVAVTDFGYASGAAWQCAEAAKKNEIERSAMTS